MKSMTASGRFSLLADSARRPLPVALAQSMATTKLGNAERMELLNRLYRTLSPADKLRCMDELAWCRLAKRGGVEATIK
jgi:hypothetical protein